MAWATEMSSDGHVVAVVELKVVIPDVPSVASTRIDYQRVGATAWTTAAVLSARGEQRVRIGGLTPGQFHNFRAITLGAMESSPMFLNNQLALGDTTAPGTPSTPTIQAQHLREFTFQTTAPSDADLKDLQWDVRTASGGAGSLVMEGTAPAIRGATSTIKVTLPASVPYGSARFLRVRGRDFTGNPTSPTAGWSTALSFTAAQASGSGDIIDRTIPAVQIIQGAITSGEIQIGAVSQRQYATATSPLSLGTSYQTFLSIPVTTAGGTIEINGAAFIFVQTANPSAFTSASVRIRNTSTGAVSPVATARVPQNVQDAGQTESPVFQETPPAGSYTFVLEAIRATDSASWVIADRAMALKELKR